MFICNRMTLAQFSRLATTEEDALPVARIASLLKNIAAKEARIEAVKSKLDRLLARRYSSAAQYLRVSAEQAADTVTLLDGDFTVKADMRPQVNWDQKKLAKLAETIFHDWQRDPEDYIDIGYSVEEQKFLAWPPDLSKHFDDARTLAVGKPRFDISAVKKARVKKAKLGETGVA